MKSTKKVFIVEHKEINKGICHKYNQESILCEHKIWLWEFEGWAKCASCLCLLRVRGRRT